MNYIVNFRAKSDNSILDTIKGLETEYIPVRIAEVKQRITEGYRIEVKQKYYKPTITSAGLKIMMMKFKTITVKELLKATR